MGAIDMLPLLFETWCGLKAYNTMFCKDLIKDWAPHILVTTIST